MLKTAKAFVLKIVNYLTITTVEQNRKRERERWHLLSLFKSSLNVSNSSIIEMSRWDDSERINIQYFFSSNMNDSKTHRRQSRENVFPMPSAMRDITMWTDKHIMGESIFSLRTEDSLSQGKRLTQFDRKIGNSIHFPPASLYYYRINGKMCWIILLALPADIIMTIDAKCESEIEMKMSEKATKTKEQKSLTNKR